MTLTTIDQHAPPAARRIKRPRPDTKFAAMVAALESHRGATLADLQAITGWKIRTLRGVLAGVFKQRFELVIASEVTARGRVYRVLAPSEPRDGGDA
jgi:lambda repressor-like predicted transcriptional regulator